jgi:hypothetical protein
MVYPRETPPDNAWTTFHPSGQFLRELEEQAKKHPGHDAELAALRQQYGWLLGAFAIEAEVRVIFEPCSAARVLEAQ